MSKPSASSFVRFLIGSIVDQPDALELFQSRDGRHDLIEVRVADSDLPNVIGRGGKTAQSLRAVLDAWTYKHRLRAHLRILDEDEEPKGEGREQGESEHGGDRVGRNAADRSGSRRRVARIGGEPVELPLDVCVRGPQFA